MKLTFHGGAGMVTGSNFLLESEKMKILVDCGIFQGSKVAEDRNRKQFPYDPGTIDVLCITHAHLDHIGLIPKLVKDGFKGRIISTSPTRDLAEVMLLDSMGVLQKEAIKDGLTPLYDKQDVLRAMKLWETVAYHEEILLDDDIHIKFLVTGHVLGSAMVEVRRGDKKIVLTGDLGNSPTPLLPDAEFLSDVDYLVMESVYGDRVHEDKKVRKEKLRNIIKKTMNKGGALIIPAFSLERTQELLYEIKTMMEESDIPLVPVFIDSPLAIKVTDIYRKHKNFLNEDVQDIIESGEKIFVFPQVHFTMRTDESKEIKTFKNPKIIIAGSGMSNGGRILHHEKLYLPDPKSTLLIVGYQSPNSLGREIQEGAKRVKIMGDEVRIRASVVSIDGYSAHRDANGLFEFVEHTADSLKKVFLAMGEPKSATILAQRLHDYLDLDTIVPQEGESFELEL